MNFDYFNPSGLPGPLARYVLGAIGPDRQTLVVPLLEAYESRSSGSTTDLVKDLTTDQLARLGPYAASFQVLQATEGRTTNHRHKIIASSSATGRTYNTAFDLCGYITANGETAESPYSTTASFNRLMRFALATSNSSGTAIETAIIWAWLAIRLRG